jgi:hypothetical protein
MDVRRTDQPLVAELDVSKLRATGSYSESGPTTSHCHNLRTILMLSFHILCSPNNHLPTNILLHVSASYRPSPSKPPIFRNITRGALVMYFLFMKYSYINENVPANKENH